MPGHWGRQMGILSHSRTSRAIILACGMAWFWPAAELAAATLISPGAAGLIRKSAEPFGLFAATMSWGGLREKWLGGEGKRADGRGQQALWDGDRDASGSPA